MTDKLVRVDLCLRILKAAPEVGLSREELAKVRTVALTYLDAELGLSPEEGE